MERDMELTKADIEDSKYALEELADRGSIGRQDYNRFVAIHSLALSALEEAQPVAKVCWIGYRRDEDDIRVHCISCHDSQIDEYRKRYPNIEWERFVAAPLTQPPAEGWQPIETAPRDGSRIWAAQVGTPERGE